MKCFNHNDADAVGICKNCSKGLCHECAVDVGKGIACKDTCADDVKAINNLIENNRNSYNSMKPRSFIMPLFLIITGAVFALTGYSSGETLTFAFYIGVLFVAAGGILLVANVTYFRKIKA